ncbi:LIM domain binding 1 [Cricetulus griseus]
MLTITFCLEDGPKRYTIGRTLIPRYFRSIFEGGATELYYVLKHPKEAFHSNFVSLDCDQGSMVTQHGKPMFTQEWEWRLGVQGPIPPECPFPATAEPARQQPSKRRKRKMSGGSTMSSGGGNTNNSNSKKKSPASTFALSSQWEGFQEPRVSRVGVLNWDMKRGRGVELVGRVWGLWGYLLPWVGRAPAPIMFGDLRHSQDVMVVGEPTLMGGEFGDEDERLITRLENTQFDAANGIDDEDSFNNSPALGANSPWNSKPPSSQESKSENPTSQASQ